MASLTGHEFEQTPGDGEGQGRRVLQSKRSQSDMTEQLNNPSWASPCFFIRGVKFPRSLIHSDSNVHSELDHQKSLEKESGGQRTPMIQMPPLVSVSNYESFRCLVTNPPTWETTTKNVPPIPCILWSRGLHLSFKLEQVNPKGPVL